MNARILALDTATEACSVALLDGERCEARYEEIGRGHAERILPMVREVLAAGDCELKDVDAIAVGRGPGAFTGVRIAISIAQGLAFGADKPVVLVSDLAAVAQRAVNEAGAGRVIAALDARMGEVYWGLYARGARGLVELMEQEHVSSPDRVALPADGSWQGAGSGWQLEELRNRSAGGTAAQALHPRLLPRAREIADLGRAAFERGESVPPHQALPVYLRDDVAVPLSQRSKK
ncbi:MAG TPA: tRNA (adenosine(37)-N6)-threonylcarbamoyltransferase complex dimerization subunit type 1 TsaB [Steroidobacteraceae bacterium]|nr:tRNA (adenosine(37)-N6)-threonylcarbamoyltransferase complex dimerization subunit type 1 TsaB [Steroidobacteraceae bacterium]